MSVVNLVNLTERLLNQNTSQGADAQTRQKSSNQQGSPVKAPTEDQFTPSALTAQGQGAAQEAGLFSVAQFSFFSTAAQFLLGQNPGSAPQPGQAADHALPITANPTNSNGAPAPSAFFPPLAAANPGPAQNLRAGVGAASTVKGLAPAATLVAEPATGTKAGAATTAPGSLVLQQQLQSLNQSLVALGLSAQEIQELDHIASIINDFNALAFTSLAFQLEELAQRLAPQNGAAGVANAPAPAAGPSTPVTNPTANAATANAGGFQIQELIIKFAGLQAHANAPDNANADANANGAAQAATGNGNATFQLNAFNLQIEEVNLTLVNGIGQTAEIQTHAHTADAANNATRVTLPKARAAVA